MGYLSPPPVSASSASPRNNLRTCSFQDHSIFTVFIIAKTQKLGVKLSLNSQITHKACCKSASPQGRQAVNYLSFYTATSNHHGGGSLKRSRDFSELPTPPEKLKKPHNLKSSDRISLAVLFPLWKLMCNILTAFSFCWIKHIPASLEQHSGGCAPPSLCWVILLGERIHNGALSWQFGRPATAYCHQLFFNCFKDNTRAESL